MNKPLYRMVQLVLAITLFSFTSIKEAPEWSVDKNHSKISFEVTHFFTPVEGYFNDYNGTLKFDPENLEGSSAEFIIKVSSVNTDNPKRDGHLQTADFFDVEKYPEMKFKSTSFEKTKDGFAAKGNLTIRDVTKEVTIPFKVLGIGDNPMKEGKKIMGLKGGLTINRNDYGVGSGNFAATTVIGDEVTITISIEAHS